MIPRVVRRATLFGAAMTLAGCDLAEFASNPKPSFEQTWNLPASSQSISVEDLLPTNGSVTILPDSSAFSMSMDSVAISAVLGPNCAQCVLLNGTTAPKPAFTMNPGNSSALPTDLVAAAITAGQITISLRNNLTFDPLFVTAGAGQQGHLVIVVRSGSVVFGRDSVRGAATPSGPNETRFGPGTTLNRTINLSTGTVTNSLQFDVSINSPVGDAVPINSNATFNATVSVPFVNVASVSTNVPSRTLDSGTGEQLDLSAAQSDAIVQGSLVMDINNPFAGITGNLNVSFKYGPNPTDTVLKSITLPSGTGQRSVTLDSADIQKILVDNVILNVSGSVSSTAPVTITPTQKVSISNRLVVKIRTPTGGN